MSTVTQRRRAFFAFLRRPPRPVLVDGAAELEAAYQIHQILAPLPVSSQRRALWHVDQITLENLRIIAEFEGRESGIEEVAPPPEQQAAANYADAMTIEEPTARQPEPEAATPPPLPNNPPAAPISAQHVRRRRRRADDSSPA